MRTSFQKLFLDKLAKEAFELRAINYIKKNHAPWANERSEEKISEFVRYIVQFGEQFYFKKEVIYFELINIELNGSLDSILPLSKVNAKILFNKKRDEFLKIEVIRELTKKVKRK